MKKMILQCPVCGKELEVIARGKGKRFFQCSECTNDLNPVLYYQPITSLKAIRKMEQGSLIDLCIKQKPLVERSESNE